jgi:hypothetical protein
MRHLPIARLIITPNEEKAKLHYSLCIACGLWMKSVEACAQNLVHRNEEAIKNLGFDPEAA